VGAALFVAALYWYVYLKGPVCVSNSPTTMATKK
jgi:hypothetical protein